MKATGGAALIYSAGPCSVCGELGDALFVHALHSGRIFFLCPSCGVAWAEPPTMYVVDAVASAASFAPTGFTVASEADIHAAGLDHLVSLTYPPEEADRLASISGFVHRA